MPVKAHIGARRTRSWADAQTLGSVPPRPALLPTSSSASSGSRLSADGSSPDKELLASQSSFRCDAVANCNNNSTLLERRKRERNEKNKEKEQLLISGNTNRLVSLRV